MNADVKIALDAIGIVSPIAPPTVKAVVAIAGAWSVLKISDARFAPAKVEALKFELHHAQHLGDYQGPLPSAMFVSLVRWTRAWIEASEEVRAGPLHAAVDAMIAYALAVCAGTHDQPIAASPVRHREGGDA